MNKIILSLLLLLPGVALFAQYPDVSIYEIQEVPVGQDSSLLLDDTVHVCGIVTVGTNVFYTGAGVSFYMQDSEGGPFSGIFVYYPYSEPLPLLVPGDSVCFIGLITEHTWPYDPPYTCNMTEIYIVPGSFELISHGHPLPPSMIITAEMIDSTGGADSLAEQYEACLVKLYEAIVDSVILYTTTSTWICHDTTSHQFIVREASDSIDYVPMIGFTFRYIQGVIYHRFGAYCIQPAYWNDLGYIGQLWHQPQQPCESDTIYFYLIVPDFIELVRADLYYRINLSGWISGPMIPADDSSYNYILPPMMAGTRVDYCATLEDTAGNIITIPMVAPWNFYSFTVDEPQGTVDDESSLPNQIRLCQNYPNPFNASTSITFNLTEASFVSLTIYDLLGREVAKPMEKQLAKGANSVVLKDLNLAGGIYFYQLRTGDFTQTKRMTLLK